MYLFSVDFSQNNLLSEQLNISSLYDLPVMNKLLIEQQLVNFSDLSIDKAYLINSSKNISFSVFNSIGIKESEIFKELALIDNNEKFIAFRNDVYFEINNLKYNINQNNDLVLFDDKSGLQFCVTGSIGQLKKLYNKNISLSAFLKEPEKFIFPYKELQDGYVNHLKSIKNYKSLLHDILNGKTFFKPPFVAEGIFTDGIVPKGDFSIVPPVYIGESVQIESGSVIGPDTVIYNNSLIAESTTIMNSVIFENVYVSSNCFIDGSVCCDNASIKRNTAVFSGSVIGADALVGEDMTVENSSIINNNVRFDKFDFLRIKTDKINFMRNKFQGLSPDKVALLGSAFAVVFKNPKIIVGCDGSPNSLSLKLAFMSGLIASGCDCLDVGVTFKSQMFFSSRFCDCDCSAFFSGQGGGTDIEFFDSGNNNLSRSQCYNLLDFCNKGKFIYKKNEECKNIRQIKGLRRMYVREITAFSDNELPLISEIICDNKTLLKTLEEIFKKCNINDSYESSFILYINESGTNASIKYKNKFYPQKILKKLVFFFMKNQVKAKVFESELYKSLWRYDSVFLIVTVLNIIKYSGKELDVLVAELPHFFIKTKSIELKCGNNYIAEKLSTKFKINHKRDAFRIKCNEGYVKLINNQKSGKIKILTASESMAISEELCDFFIRFLPRS